MFISRKYLLLISIFFLRLQSFSQNNEELNLNEAHIKTISLSLADQKINLSIPITSVKVFDERFDTTCLGIVGKPSNSNMHLIQLKDGLANEARSYYLSLLPQTKPQTEKLELDCFIKKLVLTDHIKVDNNEDKRLTSRKYNVDEMSGVLFMVEMYLQKDTSFIPFYRFDTTITGIKSVGTDGAAYISDALTASLLKATTFDWEKNIERSKKLDWQDIDSFNKQRLNIPILLTKLEKGVYLSFKDFLNNTPAKFNFTVEKNKTGDFLYALNEKGEKRLLTDLWGYCDGENMYIFSASNYFKLYRTGNSFKIYGAKDFTAKRNLRLNFGLIDVIAPNSNYAKGQTRNKYHLIKNYFLLDMETGELY